MTSPKGTINNWSVVAYSPDPYKAPELHSGHLIGLFTPVDGSTVDSIRTSSPVGKRGDLVVTKSGSLYALGTVDPAYEHYFPGARERLFVSLPERL